MGEVGTWHRILEGQRSGGNWKVKSMWFGGFEIEMLILGLGWGFGGFEVVIYGFLGGEIVGSGIT